VKVDYALHGISDFSQKEKLAVCSRQLAVKAKTFLILRQSGLFLF